MSEEKTVEKAAKKTKKASAEEVASTNPSFAFTMLDVPDDQETMVDPRQIIPAPFDSRASSNAKLEPSFVEDIKANGVLQAPLCTLVRDNESGKTQLMVIAGRRRVRAAIEAGIKRIKVDVRTMTLEDALIFCGSENLKRQQLSFFDEATYLRSLRDEHKLSGVVIASRLGVSSAKVSQYLMVFDLDPRVQKLIEKGELKDGIATKIRPLKNIEDGDVQHQLVLKGISDNWTAKDFADAVDAYLAREAEKERKKAAAAANKTKKTSTKDEGEEEEDDGEVSDKYDTKSIAVVKKESIAAVLNMIDRRLSKLQAAEDDARDPEKIAFEKGKLEGIKLVTGLKALPKSISG